jgi:hypothetical protein
MDRRERYSLARQPAIKTLVIRTHQSTLNRATEAKYVSSLELDEKSEGLTCTCDRCLIVKDYENFKKRKFGDAS